MCVCVPNWAVATPAIATMATSFIAGTSASIKGLLSKMTMMSPDEMPELDRRVNVLEKEWP